MRIRTIKPAFWTNEKLAALPDFARLLAIGLLNYADDHGFFWANSLMVRGALFPFEEDSTKVRRSLEQLSGIGYLRLGVMPDGREVGHVINFKKHQRVDKPQDSEISPLAEFQDRSKITPRTISDELPLDRKGLEGNGKDPSPKAPGDARHHEIMSRWGAAYAAAFDMKYMVASRDPASLKRFLSSCSDSADEFLGVASNAWARQRTDKFSKRCKEASTIHGLCTFYNEIRVELATHHNDVIGKRSSMA
jgi:hypothetical protein